MNNIGLIFPGQGSQFSKMGLDIYMHNKNAEDLLEEANDILGFDIGKMMFYGEDENLKNTEIAQPAIFVCSAMYFEEFKKLNLPFNVVAGHSLGEYSALYAAGVFDFKDGLLLTRKRGLFMKDSTDEKCGMAAVIGLSPGIVKKELDSYDKLYVANENSLIQTVISGDEYQLEKACNNFNDLGASKVVKLQVSTAFHTPYMQKAKEQMKTEIEKIRFNVPKCYIVSNTTAEPTKDTARIKEALIDQITSKVKWLDSFMKMKEMGINKVYEIGAGDVLKKLGMTITSKIKFVNNFGSINQNN